MIRDITLGQYYPAKSVLHRMDPRAKLVGTLVFIISVFVFHTFPGYAVATLFLAGMVIISKVPPKFMFKGLKAIVMLLMITVVFNILLTPGKVLWQWGIFHVTEEGLKLAGRMAIRLTYLVIGSSVMTLTTTPNQLTDGLERLLRPLNKLHVPIHEIAMMMSIALRFIPILRRAEYGYLPEAAGSVHKKSFLPGCVCQCQILPHFPWHEHLHLYGLHR